MGTNVAAPGSGTMNTIEERVRVRGGSSGRPMSAPRNAEFKRSSIRSKSSRKFVPHHQDPAGQFVAGIHT